MERFALSTDRIEEFTTAKSPEFNGAAEGALDIIQSSALAARIQVGLFHPEENTQSVEAIWVEEADHWTCDAMNRTATAADDGRKIPYELLCGTGGLHRLRECHPSPQTLLLPRVRAVEDVAQK